MQLWYILFAHTAFCISLGNHGVNSFYIHMLPYMLSCQERHVWLLGHRSTQMVSRVTSQQANNIYSLHLIAHINVPMNERRPYLFNQFIEKREKEKKLIQINNSIIYLLPNGVDLGSEPVGFALFFFDGLKRLKHMTGNKKCPCKGMI